MSTSSFDANTTLGTMEIAILISSFLFGIITMQAYQYLSRFPHDTLALKILVGFAWSCEFGHTISLFHAFYMMTISDYGQPERLASPPKSFIIAILLSGMIAPLVQAFFAGTIREGLRKPNVSICCFLLSLLRFIGMLILSADAFKTRTLSAFENHWRWLLTLTLAIGACNDVIIAVLLCQSSKLKLSNPCKSITHFVKQVSTWTSENGLMTSAVSVTLFICFLTTRNNFVWLSIYNLLARLFTNTLLSWLNSRPAFYEFYGQNHTDGMSDHFTCNTPSTPRIAIPTLKLPPSPSRISHNSGLLSPRWAPEVFQEMGQAI